MKQKKFDEEKLLKAAFSEALRREIEEIENATDIPVLPLTDAQKESIYQAYKKACEKNQV